jgi:hypothetical protein
MGLPKFNTIDAGALKNPVPTVSVLCTFHIAQLNLLVLFLTNHMVAVSKWVKLSCFHNSRSKDSTRKEGYWIATMKKLGGGGNHASANRTGAMASASNRMGHGRASAVATPIKHQHFAPRFTFALRTTRAPSRNVGKFYRTIKLSAENLRLFPGM